MYCLTPIWLHAAALVQGEACRSSAVLYVAYNAAACNGSRWSLP